MPIILAESTAPLLERMARDLTACRDPWARHWLVLAGSGRSEWLQRRWARIAGVAAHSQIVPLRSVIEQAASPEEKAFSRDRLVLAVAQALPSLADRIPPLPIGTRCTPVDARVLSWSEQLADAIDLSLLCRDGANRWGRSSFLGELAEHPAVRAALAGHLGTLDSEAFRGAAQRWIDQWSQRGGVPRLWIQLDAGLPQVILRCLGDLIELIPNQVHLSLLSPSRSFWGDLRTRRRWADGQDAGPVLTCLGRQAQDLHNQAIDRFLCHGSGGEELPSNAAKDSLLGRLQACCHNAAAPEVKHPIADDDLSFTVHACRSPLRELEICRDRILQAMAEDETLVANDILILLANPTVLAPLASAALAPLPVRVLGLGGALVSPVASGLRRLLKTLTGRLGLADLQALIEEPLILERFGFAGNGPVLLEWLEQAGFRWGLDARQRAEAQGEGESRWDLTFALRRLGLGAVVRGEERDGIVDGAAPLERAAGLSTALLAQLALFATALYEARQAWVGGVTDGEARRGKPLSQWCEHLTDWCNRFFGEGNPVVSEHRTQLINSIIPSLEAAAPAGLMLQSDAVLRLLDKPLESLSSGHGSGSGGITVADLRHYAGTPARMLLVVGLGSDTFPHHEDRPGWHPLASSRRTGDPDRREADRHALLLALLGCGERLVLTYQGGSDADGKERPPATPLADLLVAVDEVATRIDGQMVSQDILIRHGLNGFSPNACATTTRPVARSFLASDYAGAKRLLERDRSGPKTLWSHALPPPEHPLPLTFRELCDLVEEPCRIFVRRLGLRLPEELDKPSQLDALALDHLARWSLRDRLLQCRLTGGDVQSLRLRAEATGELPRGRYGDAIWDQTVGELPAITDQDLTAFVRSLPLMIGDRVITATLPAGWYRNEQGTVVYCSASSYSNKKLLQIKIGLLCLSLAEGTRAMQIWFKNQKRAKTLIAPETARSSALLAELCRLYQLAERLPLPFWPETYARMRGLVDKAKKVQPAEVVPEQILMAAWSMWADSNAVGQAGSPESRLLATRACFRGLDDPFAWTPDLTVDWLPQPGASLAWRLFCFVSEWEAAAGGES
jgi:exodeoxyribonuclease V gamma subunit